jgi:hypothetical protein
LAFKEKRADSNANYNKNTEGGGSNGRRRHALINNLLSVFEQSQFDLPDVRNAPFNFRS